MRAWLAASYDVCVHFNLATTSEVQLEQYKNWQKVKIYHSQYTGTNRGSGRHTAVCEYTENGERNTDIYRFRTKKQTKVFINKCKELRDTITNIEENDYAEDHKA